MVLFVCTGNTCRSPMAATILKDKFKKEGILVPVSSCGVFVNDTGPTSGAIEAMKSFGLNLANHTPTQINEKEVQDATIILTMTATHKNLVINNFPYVVEKTYTVCEYVTGEQKDISDPYGGSTQHYIETAKELEKLIYQLQFPKESQ
ncbi:MAG: low molecular weight protein arginine phosphatase [Defluviitaleaceae bacterium]|nr:low molecular weight protein arginine phosphatase [Defluviitaleaceae bacterium]